ncbi:MAG: porin family protein [Bacteroidota bacterium]
MKKSLFFLCILIGYSFSASAQLKFGAGIKGGLNFANINAVGDPDSRTGWHAGAFARLKFTKFAIQPEVYYSAQGTDDIDLDYINIPILAKFYLVGGLNIFVGPQFGILTSAEALSLNVDDAFNDSDFSLVFGAGIDLPFKLSLDARYVLGLNDINDSNPLSDFSLDGDINNRVFQVSVGYTLFGK